MRKKEFLIELEGVVGTILTYTRNPFMLGYTRELKNALAENDMDTVRIILDKVIGWYNDEMDNIDTDDYVFNKDLHHKSYDILTTFRQALHS